MARPGAYAAPNWANSQRVGDVGTKATLMLLAAYADEDYSCYPGQERIADETEQSVRTVRRQLDLLEEVGLIGREARYVFSEVSGKRVRTSDRFRLHLDVTVSKVEVQAAQERLAAGSGTRKAARSKASPPSLDLPAKSAGRSSLDLPADLAGRSSEDLEDNLAGRSPSTPTGQIGHTYRPESTTSAATSDRVTPSGTPRRTPRATSTSARDVAAVDNSGRIEAAPNGGSADAGRPLETAAGPQASQEGDLLPVDHDEVERTLIHLPDRLRPTRAEAMRLRGLIVQRMQLGWTRDAILTVVEQRLRPGGSLDNPCGLFAKILVPLDESSTHAVEEPPHQRLAVATPWCGYCDEKSRYPLDHNGIPDRSQPPCAECRQLEFAHHMERGAS